MDDVTLYIGEPSCDMAHLAHLELLTPTLEESERFFVEYLGMTVSERRGNSVYLRGWDDYARHTLKLTAAPVPGMEHFAYRVSSPQALERRVTKLERSGLGLGWIEGDAGHGPAYRFRTPDGHVGELVWEVEWYQPTPETKPALKNQASRFPARGCNVRRLDHINVFAADVRATRRFLQENLGLKLTECIIFDDGTEKGAWVTANNRVTRSRSPKIRPVLADGSIMSAMPSIRVRKCSAPRISRSSSDIASNTARTSTLFSRPFSFTSSNRVGIGSRLAAQALVSSSRLTGSRSSGPKRSASAGKLGGFPRSRHSIPTALHRSRSHAEEPRKIDVPAEGEAWLHPPQVFSIDQQFRNLVRCFKVLSQNTANRLPIDGFPPLDTLSSFQLVRRSMRDVGEGDFLTFWGHHHAMPSVQRSQ